MATRSRRYNPLRRVPTLVLDDGEALIESTAILDYLDELGRAAGKAMIAARGAERAAGILRLCALATGLGDKAVSLVYERVLRKEQLKLWVERCEAQIGGVLAVLEEERAAVKTPYRFGERIGHSDIAVACVLRFTSRGASASVRRGALSRAGGACRALRGAAAVPGDRAAARAAERRLATTAAAFSYLLLQDRGRREAGLRRCKADVSLPC